jgi:hypothetical protein
MRFHASSRISEQDLQFFFPTCPLGLNAQTLDGAKRSDRRQLAQGVRLQWIGE